ARSPARSPAPSETSSGRLAGNAGFDRGPAPLLDQLRAARRALLDGQTADIDHGAAQPLVQLGRGLQLLVDLLDVGIPRARSGRDRAHPAPPDLGQPVGVD